jgi:hypothetical protein
MLHKRSRPGGLQDLECLIEHPRAHPIVELLARDRVLPGETVAAEPDAQRQPAAAQPVEGGGLARDLGRPAPGERRDHRAKSDALGRAGDHGQGDLRIGDVNDGLAPAHLVPHERPVPPGLLGLGAQPSDEGGVGEVVEGRDVEAQPHQVCSRIASAMASQSAR